jgi:hypothetical protein
MESNKLHGYDIVTFGTSYDKTMRCIINSTRANENIARKLAGEFCRTKGDKMSNFHQAAAYTYSTWQHEPLWAFDITIR